MRWQGSYKAVGIEGLEASCDAVVVGAGPAGIMAAMESARSCDRVLLVEASRLPREKSCGGMLNAYSLRALEAFGKIPEEMILDPRWVSFATATSIAACRRRRRSGSSTSTVPSSMSGC